MLSFGFNVQLAGFGAYGHDQIRQGKLKNKYKFANFKIHSVLVLALVLSAWKMPMAFGAALPQPQGHWFLAPQISYYATDRYWNMQGTSLPLGDYGPFVKREVSLYGEYGLTQDTTITFKTAYDSLTQSSPGGNLDGTGFTQFDIGLIHGLLHDGPYVVSLYAQALLPNGQAPGSQGLLVGYDRAGLEGGILMGAYYRKIFVDSGIGYRQYFGYPSNQIRVYVNGGYDIAPAWQFLAGFSGNFGTNSNATVRIGHNIVSEPYYQLIQASLGLRYRIKPGISLVPNVSIPVWGRNTGQGLTLSMGLWFSF